MFKLAAKEALILIGTATAIAIAVYAVRPDKIGLIPASPIQDAGQQSPAESDYSEISIEDAVRLHREGGAIFADSRHAADYEAGHIQGAVHLYAVDQENGLQEFLTTTDPATTIITYCDGADCHLAQALAELLFYNGFDNVHYLKNGWTRWREGGFAVE